MGLLEFFAVESFRLMALGTAAVGAAASALGCFAYLRGQSLVGDVASHAAISGVVGSFAIAAGLLAIDGRTTLGLIIGGLVSGTIALAFVQAVHRHTVIGLDAAMAVSIALFLGGGMVGLRLVQDSKLRGKAGLTDYLFGNASAMTRADVVTSIIVAGIALAVITLTWTAVTAHTFDPGHGELLGFSGRRIDLVVLGALVLSIVVGLKAVGLILMIAFTIIPAAAARQWTRSVGGMVTVAGLIGAACSFTGAYLSVQLGRVPTGPIVVLAMFLVFVISLTVAPRRGMIATTMRRRANRRRLHEHISAANPAPTPAGTTR